MRDILFRGKRIDNAEWVYGQYAYLLNARTEDGEPIKHMIVDGTPFGQTVIPSTVGQYTGLTDQNGVKIFEGDIVVWTSKVLRLIGNYTYCFDGYHEGDVLKVVCNKAGFMLARLDDSVPDVPNGSRKIDNYEFWNFHRLLEVIGNIHDNLEFMEAQDD